MSNTWEPEVEAGIVINPNSEFAKEMRRWEMHPSVYGKTPGRPYDQVKTEYPRMLYKAQKLQSGKYSAGEIYPNAMHYQHPGEYEQAMLRIESFNKTCQRVVGSDQELEQAASNGWRKTAPEALAYAESFEQDMARAAAEAEYAVKRMSATAQAEFKAVQQDTHEHITDIQPKRKRGRPAKGVKGISQSGPTDEQ